MPIPTHVPPAPRIVDTADSKSFHREMATASKEIQEVQPVHHSVGYNTYQNIHPGVSVREPYNRYDYERFRPGDAVPTKWRDICAACIKAYRRIGIIKNMIDTMSDFSTKGVRLVHPRESINPFVQAWAKQVGFANRSERFINMLLKSAHAPVSWSTVKIPAKKREEFFRGAGSPDMEIADPIRLEKYEIPWQYKILNPLSLELLDPDMSVFTGNYRYAMRVPVKVYDGLGDKERFDRDYAVDNSTDTYMRKQTKLVRLNPDKFQMHFYKKDDDEPWADPFIFAILEDLILLEKLKLADMAALDGVISYIRVWRLGNLEHQIVPQPGAAAKLNNALINNVQGGGMDLIWTADIDLIESKSETYKFLGQDKYTATLTSVYAGLGVPPTMTGAATQGGFTNNFISVKTLLERLSYVRSVLVEFWTKQLTLLQRGMGWKEPPIILFDYMSLSDETAEKALYLQLADRGIISEEALRERFGENNVLETNRLKRENKSRKNRRIPPKLTPYSQQELELEKIALQTGVVTPGEVGLELEERPEGEVSPMEQEVEMKNEQNRVALEKQKMAGRPGQGRPRGKKDSTKRAPKRVTPVGGSLISLLTWSSSAQKQIANIVNPVYLKSLAKDNLRKLTTSEAHNLEEFKFAVLCSYEPFSDINEVSIAEVTQAPLEIPTEYYEALAEHGREPTADDLKQIQCAVYALIKGQDNGKDND